MKHYKIQKFLAVLGFISLATTVNAQKLSLQQNDWGWSKPLVDIENVPAAKTFVFQTTGKDVTVGPWIASTQDVRVVYQKSLPLKEGTISGKYYTEGMYPREGNIWITYKKGNKTITETNYWFGVTDKWEDFKFPVFAPPAGCDNMVLSFGFHMKTHGRLHLTGLQFGKPLQLPKLKNTTPVLTRASKPEPTAPSKYIGLTKSGDTWWLTDTKGNPFYANATCLYGNNSTPDETYPILQELGFNTVANGANLKDWAKKNDELIALGKQPVYEFYRVNTEVGKKYDCLVDREGLHPGEVKKPVPDVGGFNHAFPDPFDPRWEADARTQVREVAAIFKDKPYFIGWMAANERSHWNLYRYVWSHCAAIKFGKFLRSKYATIDDLNKAWNADFTSFEDLLEKKPEPLVIEGQKYEDFNTFSRIILRTFNEKILNIIHEEAPGTLVFTNRFMIHEVKGVFDNLDLYKGFDGVAVNIYPSNDKWGLDEGERQYFELLHEKTGLPLIVTEWSVPAKDSHLYDDPNHLDWSYPQLMRTQKDRAEQAGYVLADFYNMPYMVGSFWFQWRDIDSRSRHANRGIFKVNGQPWVELQKSLKDLNYRIQDLNK